MAPVNMNGQRPLGLFKKVTEPVQFAASTPSTDTGSAASNSAGSATPSAALSRVYFASSVGLEGPRFGSSGGGKQAVDPGILDAIKNALKTGFGIDTDDAAGVKKAFSPSVLDFSKDTIGFAEFVDKVLQKPDLARNPLQYEYDMITSRGISSVKEDGESLLDYHFFSKPQDGRRAIAGVRGPIALYMQTLHSAASGGNAVKRLTSLVGPAGAAKSTMMTAIKRGLENYSQSEQGELLTFAFDLRGLPDSFFSGEANLKGSEFFVSPTLENPSILIPKRDTFYQALNEKRKLKAKEAGKQLPYDLRPFGEMTPGTQRVFDLLLNYFDGDITQVLNRVKIKRYDLNEKSGVGISTYGGTADEKTAAVDDITGAINLLKWLRSGKASDPLAFAYDGALTRGVMFTNLEELYRLPNDIMDSLLRACEEKEVAAKGQPMIPIYNHVVGTSNVPNWAKVKNDPLLEALRSRTNLIYVPYNTRITDEIPIYKEEYQPKLAKRGIHVTPHTYYAAAMWAIMTRLNPDPKMTPLEKARLYNSEWIKGMNEPDVIQMKRAIKEEAAQDSSKMEGLKGMGPRAIQNAFDDAMSDVRVYNAATGQGSLIIDPILLLETIKNRFSKADTVEALTKEQRAQYIGMIEDVKKHVVGLIKRDVREAMTGSTDDKLQVLQQYITNVNAWNAENSSSGGGWSSGRGSRFGKPGYDESFMRSVEAAAGVSESAAKGYRNEFLGKLGRMINEGILPSNYELDPRTNAPKQDAEGKQLPPKVDYTKLLEEDRAISKAIGKLLAEKNGAKSLPSLSSTVKKTPEQEELVTSTKRRLIKEFGYNETSADWALDIARADNVEYKSIPEVE